jgi:hypothetical protein
MKKKIWTSLQIAWLVVAMFAAHNSILALNGAPGSYCSDMNCAIDNDCLGPCLCDGQSFRCYYPINLQSKR